MTRTAARLCPRRAARVVQHGLARHHRRGEGSALATAILRRRRPPAPAQSGRQLVQLGPGGLGGPLELHSPERKLQPAVEPAARPSRTKPKPSFLQSLGEKRLSARFSLAARQDARAESHARFNIKHKLHLNPRQSTLEQTWNRGVPIP